MTAFECFLIFLPKSEPGTLQKALWVKKAGRNPSLPKFELIVKSFVEAGELNECLKI